MRGCIWWSETRKALFPLMRSFWRLRRGCLEKWHTCTTSDLHVGFGWDVHKSSRWRKPGVWVQWEADSIVDFGPGVGSKAARSSRLLNTRHRRCKLPSKPALGGKSFAVARGPCPADSWPLLMAKGRSGLVGQCECDIRKGHTAVLKRYPLMSCHSHTRSRAQLALPP